MKVPSLKSPERFDVECPNCGNMIEVDPPEASEMYAAILELYRARREQVRDGNQRDRDRIDAAIVALERFVR